MQREAQTFALFCFVHGNNGDTGLKLEQRHVME